MKKWPFAKVPCGSPLLLRSPRAVRGQGGFCKGVALVLLLAAATLMSSCNRSAGPVAQAAEVVEAPSVSVQVAPARTGDIARVYSYSGDLKAKDIVPVVPVASGRIQSVLVQVGDTLKAGDPIAIVDSKIYATQAKQAKANLELAKLSVVKMEEGTRPEQIAAAQAAVQFARNAVNDLNTISDDERTAAVAAMAQTEAALKRAQSEYDKVSWAGQVGMLPQALQLEQATIAYEAAQSAYELQTHPSDVQLSPLMIQLAQAELALALARQPFTKTDFDLARVKVDLAESAVELVNIQMDETTIRAPFDGIVAELYIAEGSMVGPTSPAALFVSRQMEVIVNVEEGRITQVKPGQSAALRVNAYPGQDFPAVVTSVAPTADTSTHTFVVKVTPVDETGKLRSGMYADLSLLVEEKQAALLVPRAAVMQINPLAETEPALSLPKGDYRNQDAVYVVNDNTAQLRQVTTGLSDGGNVEILSGLKSDETVVIAGQASLVDGARVEVVSAWD